MFVLELAFDKIPMSEKDNLIKFNVWSLITFILILPIFLIYFHSLPLASGKPILETASETD